ncbi:MAG: glycosyltransferase family 2 protein [Sphingomonadaceae bacterium]
MPRVSVVIRAKNEATYIGETLAAVQGQRYRDYEVIVVDSGSTDRTPEIATEYGAELIPIDPKEFTYGRALNLGIAHSSGELLVSLSAHATPETDQWLGNLVSGFRHKGVAGVYGRHIPRDNASFFELLGMRLSGVTAKEPRYQTSSARFSNANGAVRRDLWEMLPFDETLPGAEDIYWAREMQRLGYAIVFEPKAAVFHSHGEPLPRLIRRQLHDQPVILRAWLIGMLSSQPEKAKAKVRSRQSVAK